MDYDKHSFLAGLSVGRTLGGVGAALTGGSISNGVPIYYAKYDNNYASGRILSSEVLGAIQNDVASNAPFCLFVDVFYSSGLDLGLNDLFFIFAPPYRSIFTPSDYAESEIMDGVSTSKMLVNLKTGEMELTIYSNSCTIPASDSSGVSKPAFYAPAVNYWRRLGYVLVARVYPGSYDTQVAVCTLTKSYDDFTKITTYTFTGTTAGGTKITLTTDQENQTVICTF